MYFLKSFLFVEEGALDFLSDGGGGGTATIKKPDEGGKKPDDKGKQPDPPPAKKKDKDEQVAEIRRQRDDLLKENESLKAAQAELDKLKGLKPVAEYVEKKFGKTDEESVNKFIEHNRERKTKLTDIEKKYQEKEQTVQELEIQRSDLWIEDYAKPLRKAEEDLFATIAMVDKEGKVRYPELFNHLRVQLLTTDKDGNPKNSIQIKQTLKEFAALFKQKTQEDYEIPKLTDVAVAVEGTYNKYTGAIKAKQNWEKTVEEKNKEKLYDNAQKQKRDVEAIIIQRGKALELAKDEFKYDAVDGIFEEDDIKGEFDKHHEYIVKVMKGEEKQLEYNVFSERMTKAALFDNLIEKYKELEKKYEKEIGKKHSSLGSGSAQSRENSSKQSREPESFSGIGFLK